MPAWLIWVLIVVAAWFVASIVAAVFVGRALRLAEKSDRIRAEARPAALHRPPAVGVLTPMRRARRPFDAPAPRILIVDDDAGLRMLLRTTLTAGEFEVAEAEDAQRASDLARFWRPKVVVLDVAMPGMDGLSFCAELKRKPAFGSPSVVLLTGTELADRDAVWAGADAFLNKPFSPLELVGVVERLTRGEDVEGGPELELREPGSEQLLLYARDLGRLLEIERIQRRVVQDAYRETVGALANALEAKDTGTGIHSLRVRDYAVQLTAAVAPSLLADPSLEYGFLLHDVGKIGVPSEVLAKPGPLSLEEFALMQQHPLVGTEILAGVTFLREEGLNVIRSHHERWDGSGYPDHLSGAEIPLSARIFAVADAVDAMTGERPYREPTTWGAATSEVAAQSGSQFDPEIVDAFIRENEALRRIYAVTARAA